MMMEEFKINLKILWESNISDLPIWIWYENVIYRIHNLITDKSYIGQTILFIERLRLNRGSHYRCYIDGDDYVIYKAIRKYNPENFEVSILEYDCNDLNSREIYWIDKLHTWIHDPECNGYNMTKGGDKPPTELGRIALLKLYPNTNGVPPQFTKSGHEALINKYGMNGASPQFINAGRDTMNKLYGMNGMSPQCISEAHTDVANLNRSISRIFYAINRNLGIITKYDPSPDSRSYVGIGESKIGMSIYINIKSTLKYIDILRLDKRWTDQMELIFSKFEIKGSKIIIKED